MKSQNQTEKQQGEFQLPEINCKIHQTCLVEHIYLNVDSNNLLVCNKCIDSNKCNSKELVNIKEFFQKNSQNVIQNWPPLQDQKLKEQLNNKDLMTDKKSELIIQITKFFEQFRTDVSKIIDDHKKSALALIEENGYCRESFLSVYNQLSQKEEMMDQLLNNQSNLEESLRNMIGTKLNSQFDEQLLKYSLDDLTKTQQKLQFDHLQKYAQQIKQGLKSIDFLNNQSSNVFDNRFQVNQTSLNPASTSLVQIQTQKQNEQKLNLQLIEIDSKFNLSLLQDHQKINIVFRQQYNILYSVLLIVSIRF